ncbi:protein-L-isoaspartate(D-aspartate) O-methyltransferase [Haliscomenobacter hydrossis]|uniref:Protein-L-isoaspartate O-methyltransferase n=1 Tax=Haliscomenobacter hydrossis (strain ATCC 27775 / DSM 1100 / LMG 10767 / O) TaxID=760192 RepID=F4KU32_HALH1|nr:protein-L-isoaspartate(D-aspartate) O-methyltransferase [Haliscomenobacter hydrossis]AEE49168.1 Protein-L-isoaspartate O-methyltransferase [Haliscomenobacter hydrossis DSM 1100]
MQDTYRHRGMRRRLVEGLRKRGIKDEKVLEAIGTLPRHFFLDKAFEDHAYLDKAFPIGNDQTISQPYTVAYMTELLEVEKRHKTLEVGTGSGYQACVLAQLGARVYSIERQKDLYERAKMLLPSMGYPQIRLFYRDGYKGLPEYAPFDRIIVTAGAPYIPEALREQLAVGGVMVIPVGEEEQTMVRVRRIAENLFEEEPLGPFRFVPFVEGLNE